MFVAYPENRSLNASKLFVLGAVDDDGTGFVFVKLLLQTSMFTVFGAFVFVLVLVLVIEGFFDMIADFAGCSAPFTELGFLYTCEAP